MKRASVFGVLIACAIIFPGCSGGGGGASDVEGPILDVSQAEGLSLDQLFINGGVEDEYLGQGEFSVYLRDVATGKDLACTTADDGMSYFASAGVYYGHLSVPFRQVSTDHPSAAVRFKLIFVEQDSAGCPAPIGAEDTVVGESAEFAFDTMFNVPIWAGNGKALAVLRETALAAGSAVAMAPSRVMVLAIDKLYFEYDVPKGVVPRFYLFADRVDDGQTAYQCQIDDASMVAIRAGGILYSALGLPFSCFDLSDVSLANVKVRIGLYVQGDSGPELVGQTEPKTIGQLVGERVDFDEGSGYLTFQRVNEQFFGSSVVRLADLTAISVVALNHTAAATSNASLELHAVAGDSGLPVACAGPAQGLSGIAAAGSYDGLSAQMVAMEGTKELFGWDRISLWLVERTDGRSCPWPLESAPNTIAGIELVTAADLAGGTATFADNKGSLSFVEAAAEGK
ncbi:MAG: hypothetical protein WC956_00815 [bacterium]